MPSRFGYRKTFGFEELAVDLGPRIINPGIRILDETLNFSFSLVLLDAHNTGVVITSMYGREQNRIYTKKITNGKSDTALTDEEQQAIEIANSKK